MNFATAAIHPLPDPAAAARFLEALPGFVLEREEAGRLLLSNGSLSLLLVAGETPAPLPLLLACRNLAEDGTALARIEGVAPLGAAQRISLLLEEQRFSAPFGFELWLQRRYSEDEVDSDLPLPTALDWQPAAISALQRLLRVVPHQFRDRARLRATAKAEELAIGSGEVSVALADAMRAMVLVTPAFQLRLLWQLIVELGHDPQPPFAGIELLDV